ncbi:toxic anion resistance protein [Lentibacillus sediminis]|uniref:toxic anion resistance protein n=1 Tax=Lentibacillus sediminis TaxID=1940529 RepID=UPI000C1BA5E7|nr:toxic anion resistance protein [Lentibacillus sediminis]
MKENQEQKRSGTLDDLLANPFGAEDTATAVKPRDIPQDGDKPQKMSDRLSEEDRGKAQQLAKQIEPGDRQAITEYGTQAQSQLTDFSHKLLDHVQKKDTGEIGDVLTDLMKKLEQVNPEELQQEKQGFLRRIFGKVSGSVNEMLSRYQKTGAQIDRIRVQLDRHRNALTMDNDMLDDLFDKNRDYFDALTIYIAAGEMKLEELETTVIPQLKQKADKSGSQMDVQEVNDMLQFADRLDKRTHDLKLSRQITMQSAPQIRLIQNTNQALVEKIQSSVMTAIPLWKNQIATALTLLRQQKAVEAQKQVSDTTNELLEKNSEMLKTNAIETAKENERGLVDVETLKKTQGDLITTIEETIRIQSEGREKRQQAEKELTAMEGEMKQKLLEMRN